MQEYQHFTASECCSAIIGEMSAVRKARGQNVNYDFRSIDQVMDAINPYISKYGLSVNTEIITFEAGHFDAVKKGYNNAPDTIVRKTKATIKVRITLTKQFFTENFKLISTNVSFEGTAHSDDSGDKALTQAQSNAYKYALIMGFCMKSADTDPDDKKQEETVVLSIPQTTQPKAQTIQPMPFEQIINLEKTREIAPSKKQAGHFSLICGNFGCTITTEEKTEYEAKWGR